MAEVLPALIKGLSGPGPEANSSCSSTLRMELSADSNLMSFSKPGEYEAVPGQQEPGAQEQPVQQQALQELRPGDARSDQAVLQVLSECFVQPSVKDHCQVRGLAVRLDFMDPWVRRPLRRYVVGRRVRYFVLKGPGAQCVQWTYARLCGR